MLRLVHAASFPRAVMRRKGLERDVALTDELFGQLYGQGIASGRHWKLFAYSVFSLIPVSVLTGLVRLLDLTGFKRAIKWVAQSLSQSGTLG